MNPNETNYISQILLCLVIAIQTPLIAMNYQLDIFSEDTEVSIQNIDQLNSKGLDFCAIPYGDGIVFTSSRNQEDGHGMRNVFNKNYFDLYYSKRNKSGVYREPQKLKGDINGKLHDGTATFNRTGDLMFFTRNNRKTKGLIGLKIYTAQKVENQWINVKELPFNSTKFSNCHPTLSQDEAKLYFASDRPGGYGGMDIYVTSLRNGVWTEPQNLGVNVNSKGNELFPYIDSKGDLYFSSDGAGGQGRLDIYKSSKDGKRFKRRANLGEPFNTRSDDFGFYIDESGELGFLSSNRLGGHGNDDVYSWELKEKKYTRKFIVIDEQSGEKIEEAEVVIEQELNTWSRTKLKTNEIGDFIYPVKKSNEYHINILKEGFIDYAEIFDLETLMAKEEHVIHMRKRNFSLLSGKVEGQIYHEAMPGVEIELINECDGRKQVAKSSKDGSFGFTIMCGCEYIVIAKKDGFLTTNKIIPHDENNCDRTQLIERVLLLRPSPSSSYPRASAFDEEE